MVFEVGLGWREEEGVFKYEGRNWCVGCWVVL